MLRIDLASRQRGAFCDGATRRQALWLGGSSLLAGLSLPRLFEMESQAATDRPARARSCIFIFLRGGPSTIDMWDLKPEAPAEIRGPYKPIATNVPGITIGERLPRVQLAEFAGGSNRSSRIGSCDLRRECGNIGLSLRWKLPMF